MDCALTLVAGRWTCPQCGWVYPRESEKPPRRNCPAGGKVRGSQFAVRSEEAQAACRVVCAACDEFRYGDARGDWCNACKSCGSQRGAVYESRLRVGDCPRGKWAISAQNAPAASQ
jgi:hypothetical protein